MEWTQIKADWETSGVALQDRWGRLTEDDLAMARAGRNELVACVQKRYRIQRDIAERHVDGWIKSRG